MNKPQKPTVSQTAAAREASAQSQASGQTSRVFNSPNPDGSNANASGVAAAASGMSLFYAFDKSSARENPLGDIFTDSGERHDQRDKANIDPIFAAEDDLSQIPDINANLETRPAGIKPFAASYSAQPSDPITSSPSPTQKSTFSTNGPALSDADAATPLNAAPDARNVSASEASIPSDEEPPLVLSIDPDVTDINEAAVSAVSDSNGAANAVNENAAIGTNVGITAFASDSDGTDSVSYSLSDDAGGLFAIDATTGVVTVAGAIDRESAASHTIEVTATSTDGSTSTQSYTIAINDLDEFDVSPVIDTDAGANTLAEDAAAGTAVGVIASASDADATTNAVSYSVDDTRFSVDPDGTVRVAAGASFDFETEQSIDILVTATSADGSTSAQTFTIDVTNVVDEAPTDITFTGGTVNETVASGGSIDSSYNPSGATVAVLSTTDADGGIDSFTYAITNDPSGHFEIVGNEVRVRSGQNIDYETAASHDVTIQVTDANGATYLETITINVADYEGSYTTSDAGQSITGTSEEDVLTGGTGNDVIRGGTGADQLSGGDGNDTLYVDADDTLIHGGGGDDTVRVDTSAGVTLDMTAAEIENAVGNAGDDQFDATGSTVGVELYGNDGNDSLTGGDAGDRLQGGAGADQLIGGGGNDTLYVDADDTVIHGGDGDDTVRVDTSAGVTLDLTTAEVENAFGNAGDDQFDATGSTVGVELYGNDGNDSLTGGDAGDRLQGGAGADQLIGGGGNDTLYVDADDTLIHGGDGDDTVRVDTSAGVTLDMTAAEIENAVGNAGDDQFDATGSTVRVTLRGNDGDDILTGGEGNDEFNGGADADQFFGGGGNDFFYIDADDTLIRGGDGNDTVIVATAAGVTLDMTTSEIENAVGNAGNDQFDATGSTVRVTLRGNDGDDILTGGSGNDLVEGGDGADQLTGGGGSDTIDGGADIDTAIFSGNRSDYTISVEGSGYRITDTRSGSPDGSDLVLNVENFQFADMTVADADLLNSAPTDLALASSGVAEDASAGQVVGTLSATDADSGEIFSYALVDGSGNPVTDSNFEIVGNEIRVRTGANLDAEASASHDLIVQVTDSAGFTFQKPVTVTVNDVDEFDVSPVSDSNGAANAVNENAAIGTTVGITAFASDADATTNGVTYSLTDDAGGLFAIDSSTGVVTVAGALDFESQTSHAITVRATSADGSISTQSFNIGLNDINEAPTDIAFSGATVSAVSNTIAAGTIVANIDSVADQDGGESFTYTLTDDAGGAFTINSATGAVSLVANTDISQVVSDTVTVQVTDSGGNTYNETIGIQLGTTENDSITGTSNDDIIYGLGSFSTSGSNLIVNGSFEADIISGEVQNFSSITGWSTTTGDIEIKRDGHAGINASDGNQWLEMDAQSAVDMVYQDVQTQAGTDYILSLDVARRSGHSAETNTIHVYWAGQLIETIVPTNTSWETLTFTVTGTGGLDRLEFREDATNNNSYGGFIDNVTMLEIANNPDTLNGGAGNDTIHGGAQGDLLIGGAGDDRLYGGAGNDTLRLESGADVLDGGDGHDVLDIWSSGGVTVNLATGTVSGTGVNGTTVSGIEEVWGGDGNDTLTGSSAAETLYGYNGNDTISGGAGDDNLYGEVGEDQLSGGTGDDMLSGGAGDDEMYGEDGNDIFIYAAGDGRDDVSGGSGGGWTDTITLQGMDGAISIDGRTVTGQGWEMDLDSGSSVVSQNGESLTLSNDASGRIEFADGDRIDFAGIERITW